ncbi:MCE family protein [Gordonia sp. CPCC 205333]|uniref:MCE family protein n=1 Tax=Gordonia sp. CPCC 205333 TaxID=3140790 RepID=UPI003AF3476F
MLRMDQTKKSLTLGVISLLAVLGLSGCSMVPESWKASLGQANEITAYFQSVSGLYNGNDVAVLGMPIGQVTSVEPQGNRVKVTFTVDKGVKIPADATAAIVNTSIVTTRHIELSPAYSSGPTLDDGAVIKNAKEPVEVGELLDSIDKLVVALNGDKPGEGPVADLLEIQYGVTKDNGVRLRKAIDQLAKTGQIGASNGQALVDIIKSVNELTTKLVAGYPKMKNFSDTITSVTAMLQEQSPGLMATMANLNQTLTNTTEFLSANVGTLNAGTSRLAALASNLSDYSRQVVETIDLAPLLFQNLSNSVSAEQGAWRAQVLLDKSLLDNEMLSRFCEAINLQKDGCRTGQLKDFGPDLGVFSALLELSK